MEFKYKVTMEIGLELFSENDEQNKILTVAIEKIKKIEWVVINKTRIEKEYLGLWRLD